MDSAGKKTEEGIFSNGGGEQYHKMIEEVEDYAILMLDNHGIIRNWNKGAEKIKGYKEAEIVGHHFRIFYTKEDRQAGLPDKLIGEAARLGKATHEGWRVRKDGTTFWGSIVITALHDEDGRVVGFTKVTRDLTERKLAEDTLLRNALQLELQNRELQQFANAAAHDMKEPLRKMQFYYSAILSEGVDSLSDTQRSYLDRSADAAARMQRLIDDLLAFTRIAEPASQMEPVDLNLVIKEVITFFQDTLDEVGGSVAASPLPTIPGIRFQIWQLFVNLFSNSIKYKDPGKPLRIEISADELSNPNLGEKDEYLPTRFLRIWMKDNGIGFATVHAERIFDMFERLHGRRAFEGSGIGLAICRRVMSNHKGYIRAQGYPGEGATFELLFPA